MHLVDAYLDACVVDIGRAVDAGLPEATSVFFGGGTPSLVPAEALIRVLDHIPLARDAEVTVECNPDTVDVALLRAYRSGGVNRLSFGVQSMVPHVLASLGRTHDPANVTSSVAAAREAGFDSFNLDLIYGAAGETLERLDLDARARARARAAARQRVRPHGRARHSAGGRAGTSSRRRRPGRQVPRRRPHARRRRAGELRDLELGEAWPRVPAQPPLLVAGGLPRRRLRGALASRREFAGGTCARRSATSRRSPPVSHRSLRPSVSTKPNVASRRCSSLCARAMACRRARCPRSSRISWNAKAIESC